MKDLFDIVILGGGPAGLTAGLYACRAGMKTLLIEKMACGGQILITDRIENFPGFPEGIRGPDLGEWMFRQAEHFGLKVEYSEVKEVMGGLGGEKDFSVKLANGKELKAVSVIVATGARWSSLGIPGEKELSGRGVSYCATCDGPLFKGKEVVVVGGGDTALEDAIFLTKFAGKVTVVHRRERLRAANILQERARGNKKIEFCLNSVAVEITGKDKCEAVITKDVVTGSVKEIRCDGIFVLIGITPNSDTVKNIVRLDDKGYIICDEEMGSSQAGIFACGDVRKKTFRQVVTAAGDGATAAFSAEHYVERQKGIEYPRL